jgi:hypothetical protein
MPISPDHQRHWIGFTLAVPKLAEKDDTESEAGELLGTIRTFTRSPAFSATLLALVQVVLVSAIVQVFEVAACDPPAGVTITMNA